MDGYYPLLVGVAALGAVVGIALMRLTDDPARRERYRLVLTTAVLTYIGTSLAYEYLWMA